MQKIFFGLPQLRLPGDMAIPLDATIPDGWHRAVPGEPESKVMPDFFHQQYTVPVGFVALVCHRFSSRLGEEHPPLYAMDADARWVTLPSGSKVKMVEANPHAAVYGGVQYMTEALPA